ncbi:TetR/AcrR family transcriptional regulator [Roseobacter sp. N2S]|uniref:TetR/AcrR family transcriptional regulator n=1 Tax=Roseobacter sp. N2S TaxID=2663844 RepID=UPI002861CFB9|nr:TetR/AcrR family transcriptional regulator [Roseobacter sp. N2S]MDR6267417.1 AcrR family transcriptional regulator [Roseobacter sp. N2S]
METDKQKHRRERIEDAAYAVLQEKGYKGASMLDIAKRAGCSNETLYRWYGNKQTLFASLVTANAAAVKAQIEQSIQTDGDTIEELRLLGPQLLDLVTSRRAIALNRAAAGDVYHTGTLGPAIAQGGKDTIAPLVGKLIASGMERQMLQRSDPAEIAAIFIALLIGDTQIQRVIGVIPELTDAQKEDRADRACAVIQKLYGV